MMLMSAHDSVSDEEYLTLTQTGDTGAMMDDTGKCCYNIGGKFYSIFPGYNNNNKVDSVIITCSNV